MSDHELAAVYAAWKRADRAGKQRLVAEPLLFLRALAASQAAPADDEDAAGSLLKDLTTLAAIAWRASRRAHQKTTAVCVTAATHTQAWSAAAEAFAALGATIEEMHAGPDHPTSHPDPA